jgi:hypothetical protein
MALVLADEGRRSRGTAFALLLPAAIMFMRNPQETAVTTFAVLLAVLQVTTGVVSSYLGDIATLVAINSATLAPRFMQARQGLPRFWITRGVGCS